MKEFNNNRRYDLEKAQEEAQKLRYLIDNGTYPNYAEADYHLDDEYFEEKVRTGHINRLVMEELYGGMWIDPDNCTPDRDESEIDNYQTNEDQNNPFDNYFNNE